MNTADILCALGIVCLLAIVIRLDGVIRIARRLWIRLDLWHLQWGQREAGPAHEDSGYIAQQIAQRKAQL